ncbi:MAG: hypothetical protein R2757_21985 [Draconibacterium sp.]
MEFYITALESTGRMFQLLRCQLFEEQLATLNPDLVILGSLGQRCLCKTIPHKVVLKIITRTDACSIWRALPKTAIIMVTNNDSYMYRDTQKQQKSGAKYVSFVDKFDTGVWDMYAVMGGVEFVSFVEKTDGTTR